MRMMKATKTYNIKERTCSCVYLTFENYHYCNNTMFAFIKAHHLHRQLNFQCLRKRRSMPFEWLIRLQYILRWKLIQWISLFKIHCHWTLFPQTLCVRARSVHCYCGRVDEFGLAKTKCVWSNLWSVTMLLLITLNAMIWISWELLWFFLYPRFQAEIIRKNSKDTVNRMHIYFFSQCRL